MPEQNDIASQWASFDAPRRQRLLARMSPEQKSKLRGALEGGPSAPTQAADTATDATLSEPTSALGRVWKAANTPIGSHDKVYRSETQKLDDVQDFAKTEAGREAYRKHPTLTAIRSVAAGMERDVANMFTPAFVATSVAPMVTRFAAAIAPGLAPALNVAGKVAHAGTAAGFGAGGAAQVYHAATTSEGTGEQRAMEALGGVGAMLGTAAEAGKGLSTRRNPGGLRRTAQDILGAGEDFQKKVASGYAEDAQKVRDKNQKATEDTLRDRGQVDDAHAKKTAAYHKRVAKQLKEDFGKQEEVRQQRKDVQAENDQRAQEHGEVVGKKLQEREAAEHVDAMRTAAEGDLQHKTDAYYAKEDAVKASAFAQNNENWKAWRDKVGDTQQDIAPIGQVIEQQAQRMDPNSQAIFRQIATEASAANELNELREQVTASTGFGRGGVIHVPKPGGKIGETVAEMIPQRGYAEMDPSQKMAIDSVVESMAAMQGIPLDGQSPITMNRLQGWYTELGQKQHSTGGTLPGNVYKAIDEVRQAVGRQIEEGSKQAGAYDDLVKARTSHGEYMDAFGRARPARTTLADIRKKAANPEQFNAEDEQRRLDAVAKHDPSLVTDYRGVQAAADHANSFPSNEQLRKSLPEIPDRPKDKPLPDVPGIREVETAPQKPDYPEPRATTPEASVPDIRQATRQQIETNLQKYGKVGTWVARTVIGAGLGHTLLHGDFTGFGEQYFLGEAGIQILSRVLRKPSVLDWMSKPTADTLDAIDSVPPRDADKLREALTGLAVEDAKRGGRNKLDPRVASFLGQANLQVITAAIAASQPRNAAEAKRQAESLRVRPVRYNEQTSSYEPVPQQ